MAIVLDRIDIGVEKYCWIMTRLHQTDVSKDKEFQRNFNGFYRMRQRPAEFYKSFYTYLETNKNNSTLSFAQIITYLYLETGQIHASFSSKLLATVNPDMPIWDKFVLTNIGLRAPHPYEKDRLEKTIQVYKKICEWYKSEEAVNAKKEFERYFPCDNISDVKKADFILWGTR